MNWSRVVASRLNSDALNTVAVYRDWRNDTRDDLWEIVDPISVMGRAAIIAELEAIGFDVSDLHEGVSDLRLEDVLRDSDFLIGLEPMANWAYPLPGYHGDPERDQWRLAAERLAVTLVRLPQEWDTRSNREPYVLALSGCGMDLSWDIAEAYIILGYLPPAWIHLPRFAGEKYTPRKAAVIRAMRRGLEVRRNWLRGDALDLKVVETWLKEGR